MHVFKICENLHSSKISPFTVWENHRHTFIEPIWTTILIICTWKAAITKWDHVSPESHYDFLLRGQWNLNHNMWHIWMYLHKANACTHKGEVKGQPNFFSGRDRHTCKMHFTSVVLCLVQGHIFPSIKINTWAINTGLLLLIAFYPKLFFSNFANKRFFFMII